MQQFHIMVGTLVDFSIFCLEPRITLPHVFQCKNFDSTCSIQVNQNPDYIWDRKYTKKNFIDFLCEIRLFPFHTNCENLYDGINFYWFWMVLFPSQIHIKRMQTDFTDANKRVHHPSLNIKSVYIETLWLDYIHLIHLE